MAVSASKIWSGKWNFRYLLIHLSLVWASLFCPIFSYAMVGPATPFLNLPSAFTGKDDWEQAQEAYQNLQSDPQIQIYLADPRTNSLIIIQTVAAPELQTTKFQQYYRGIEVIGSVALHQRSRRGTKVLNRLSQFDMDVRPTLSQQQAWGITRAVVGDRDLTRPPELKILPSPYGGGARLVYWLHLKPQYWDGGREVILDAHSGALIGNISTNESIAPIEVYNAQGRGLSIVPDEQKNPLGKSTLKGCRVTIFETGESQTISPAQCNAVLRAPEKINGKFCQIDIFSSPVIVNPKACAPGNPTDPASAHATANSAAVLNYFLSHHGRNSYDNSGSPAISVVHAGLKYVNAHWSEDEKIMVYGDGDSTTGLGDFTQALDVAGHEMTHGVTQFSAGFLGMGESGALNEANSDFFGVMITGGTEWAIGKSLFVNSPNPKGVRDLSNPANVTFAMPGPGGTHVRRPFPAHIKDLVRADGPCDDTNDNCWVHINSTIEGHASYLVTRAIGAAKAEHLYYVTLTQAWTAKDTIQTAAESVKSVCDDLYDQATCALVKQAYAQVGL